MKRNLLVNLFNGSLFKESSLMAFSSAFSAVSRFLLVTILARYLSPESYGVWVSITSVAAIMMYGDFGITNALRNKISILRTKEFNTENTQREYFYTAFYFFLTFSVLLSLLFVFFSGHLPLGSLYNTQNEVLKQQGVEIFVFIQVTFLLGIPFGMVSGLFFSYDETKHVATYNIFSNVVTLGSVLVLSIFFKANIVILAKIYFSLNLILGLFYFIFFVYKRKWYNNLSIDLKQAPVRIKELLNKGIMFLGIQLSTSYTNNLPTIFLASVADLKIAASFNIAQKLYTMVLTIYQSIFNPIWSKLASLSGQYKWHDFKLLHLKIILITLLFFIVTTIGFTFTAKYIYYIVAGDLYDVSRSIIILLGISTTFYAMFEAASLFQNATSRLKVRLFSQLFLVIIVNIIFKNCFEYFGIESIPFVLGTIWLVLFSTLYVESVVFMRGKLHKKSIL